MDGGYKEKWMEKKEGLGLLDNKIERLYGWRSSLMRWASDRMRRGAVHSDAGIATEWAGLINAVLAGFGWTRRIMLGYFFFHIDLGLGLALDSSRTSLSFCDFHLVILVYRGTKAWHGMV